MKESASTADLLAISSQEWPSFTAGSLKEIAAFFKTIWTLGWLLRCFCDLGFITGSLGLAQLVFQSRHHKNSDSTSMVATYSQLGFLKH